MKQVFIAQHPTEAHFLRGLLEAEGIDVEVHGEALFGARGEAPLTADTLPSVWLTNDEQLEAAMTVVESYSNGADAPGDIGETWACPNCGEQCEAQFSECWQCCTSRPA